MKPLFSVHKPMMDQFNSRVFTLLLVVIFTVSGFISLFGLMVGGEVSAESNVCNIPADYSTIQSAINTPACETIQVGPGTYVENLSISRGITIIGSGTDSTILDANFARGVRIATTDAVNLSDFQIRNGLLFRGSAIDNDGASLTVDNLFIVDNTATSNAAAIFVTQQSSLVLKNSVIQNNESVRDGGAIKALFNTEVLIENTQFIGNVGGRGGGGIWAEGTLTVRDSSFINNVVTGGLNQPNSGGGVYAPTMTETLTIENSYFENNDVVQYGGGVFSEAKLLISDTTFEGNHAVASGGGLYTRESDATLNNVVMINNTAQIGGGYYSRLNNVAIESSTFSLNESNLNGGGIVVEFVTATIKSSQVDANMSVISGAGVWLNESTVEIVDSSINDNIATSNTSNGGGLFAFGDTSNVTVKQTNIKDNEANSGAGIASEAGLLTIENSLIDGNLSALKGGGISAETTQFTLHNTVVSNNQSGDGAGIYLNNATSIIQESTVANNNGNSNGAGIFIQSGDTHLLTSSIKDNSASNGAGIYNTGQLTATTSAIYNNIAVSEGGGIWNDGRLRTENLTVSGNSATIGGGLYNDNGDPSIRFTTFANNLATDKSASVHSDRSTLRLRNTILNQPRGGVPHCDGNLFSLGYNIGGDDSCNLIRMTDREFETAQLEALGDYGGLTFTHAMKPTSLAIDKGEDDICPSGDQIGQSRPYGNGCDIGAYEFNGYSVGFKESDMIVDETAGVITVTIRLNQPWQYSSTPTVDYAVTSNTAISGEDFEGSSGTISYAINRRGFKLVIPIFDDTTAESAESFFVTLSNANGIDIGDNQLIITIAENDGGGGVGPFDFHIYLPLTQQ